MSRAVIVVPCRNEAARLRTEEFRRFGELHPEISLVFVDDGSTDDTAEVLESLASSAGNIRVLKLERNRGKAEAVRQGMLTVLPSACDCGFWDADLSTPLDEIPPMLELLRSGNFACVAGSRWLHLGECRIERRFFRHFIGRIFATCVSLKLKLPVYDTQCGAKVFTAQAAETAFREPFATRWFFDVEIFMRLQKARTQADPGVLEYPVRCWIDAPGSKVSYLRAFIDFIKLMALK